jgi:hypothetical protein
VGINYYYNLFSLDFTIKNYKYLSEYGESCYLMDIFIEVYDKLVNIGKNYGIVN